MYGDGVDPVEDELIDKTMAVHNLRVAAKRDADAMAVLTAAVSERDRLLLAARSEAAELRGKLAEAERNVLIRVVEWLRESQRMTLAQGKPRTATTVKDLADALEKLLPARAALAGGGK